MGRRQQANRSRQNQRPVDQLPLEIDQLEEIPVSVQHIEETFTKHPGTNPFALRVETMKRIERITGRPLCCYVSKTAFLHNKTPSYCFAVDDSDIEGFDTLIDTVPHNEERAVDILLTSNGGSPEATERIVRLLRQNFNSIRFIVASNAFSAATMMAFSGDALLMTDVATLGPIDPQVGGIPARAILRGFEDLERRAKEEGPEAITPYLDLVQNYSLHLLEICKSAEALSRELARSWLSQYMLKCDPNDPQIDTIVTFFADFDSHKSHGRSVGRDLATEVGLLVEQLERGQELDRLVRSLNNQFSIFFRNTPFCKAFENAYGAAFGRQYIPTDSQLTD